MTTAHVTVSTARIADDFARSWIVRLFGADIERYFHAAGFDGRLLHHDALLAGVQVTP